MVDSNVAISYYNLNCNCPPSHVTQSGHNAFKTICLSNKQNYFSEQRNGNHLQGIMAMNSTWQNIVTRWTFIPLLHTGYFKVPICPAMEYCLSYCHFELLFFKTDNFTRQTKVRHTGRRKMANFNIKEITENGGSIAVDNVVKQRSSFALGII